LSPRFRSAATGIRGGDPEAHRVFNNLEDKNEVAVIDTKSHQVVTNWPIAPGEEASRHCD